MFRLSNWSWSPATELTNVASLILLSSDVPSCLTQQDHDSHHTKCVLRWQGKSRDSSRMQSIIVQILIHILMIHNHIIRTWGHSQQARACRYPPLFALAAMNMVSTHTIHDHKRLELPPTSTGYCTPSLHWHLWIGIDVQLNRWNEIARSMSVERPVLYRVGWFLCYTLDGQASKLFAPLPPLIQAWKTLLCDNSRRFFLVLRYDFWLQWWLMVEHHCMHAANPTLDSTQFLCICHKYKNTW